MTKAIDNELKMTPPISTEARELKLINLAMVQAEKELLDGKASSQIMTHFLKLGTEKEKTERERLHLENKLLEEKIKSEQSTERIEEKFDEVIDALESYRMIYD